MDICLRINNCVCLVVLWGSTLSMSCIKCLLKSDIIGCNWIKMFAGLPMVPDLSRRQGTIAEQEIKHTLHVSENIWLDLSMNFMLRLPCTRIGWDSILFVVDRLSKITYFITCKKTKDAFFVAHLFFQKVMHLHGIPKFWQRCEVHQQVLALSVRQVRDIVIV